MSKDNKRDQIKDEIEGSDPRLDEKCVNPAKHPRNYHAHIHYS